MNPNLPARVQQLLDEVDRLRAAGLQLWLSAGSAVRVLENGQYEIPGVRLQVTADVRRWMAEFKATKDREFFPWEIGEPFDPRFKNWVQGGERLTGLLINATVYRRDDQRFVYFSEYGAHWLPEDQYGEEPVRAANRLSEELRIKKSVSG